MTIAALENASVSRTPQGVRGLKSKYQINKLQTFRSHPARGAWIEIIEEVTQ